MRVAAYDETTDTLATWPPGTEDDIPDQWGIIQDFSEETIPEGFSLAFVAVL